MIDPDVDPGLIRDMFDDRLQTLRAASLRGMWDAPGEFLDSDHEDAYRAELAAEEAAAAQEAHDDLVYRARCLFGDAP